MEFGGARFSATGDRERPNSCRFDSYLWLWPKARAMLIGFKYAHLHTSCQFFLEYDTYVSIAINEFYERFYDDVEKHVY